MKDAMLCRRMFLKSSAFFAATALCARTAFAKFVEGSGAAGVTEGKLSLYNVNCNERLTVIYRNGLGEYCEDALRSLNWILRCHRTNETTKMDLRVIEYLNRLDNSLGGDNEIHIISGYRSPTYNAELRRRSQGVARHSLHTKGMAIDLAIPSFGLDRIRKNALALAAGGVGYYPRSGFVHIDAGHFRTW